MSKNGKWAYRKANGMAKGTQDWTVDHMKADSVTYTGLWNGSEVVALLVGKGFDEGEGHVTATGDFLVEAANAYPGTKEKLAVLQEKIDLWHERLDNVVAANRIPMPPHLRETALVEVIETLRNEMLPHINYDPL